MLVYFSQNHQLDIVESEIPAKLLDPENWAHSHLKKPLSMMLHIRLDQTLARLSWTLSSKDWYTFLRRGKYPISIDFFYMFHGSISIPKMEQKKMKNKNNNKNLQEPILAPCKKKMY